MKLLYLFFSLVSILYSSAQNNNKSKGKIIYEVKVNFGLPMTENWFLFFDDNKSVYYIDKSFKPLEKDIPKVDEVIEIKTEDILPHIIFDFAKDSIYNQNMIFVKPYYVVDKIFSPKWQIVKEYKTIGNYECQKATTNFRGRNYIAWFAEKIPVKFGPWKLNGLPGLILEVQDELNVIKITATSIDIGSTLDFDFSTNSIPKKGTRVSMKEYVVLKDNEYKEIRKYLISKQERNTEIEFNESPVKRNGLELTYEWEQNEKE